MSVPSLYFYSNCVPCESLSSPTKAAPGPLDLEAQAIAKHKKACCGQWFSVTVCHQAELPVHKTRNQKATTLLGPRSHRQQKVELGWETGGLYYQHLASGSFNLQPQGPTGVLPLQLCGARASPGPGQPGGGGGEAVFGP